MAFIRKRGQSYYLVHNVRKKGRIQQLHLARLGRRPWISDEVIEGVTSKHPFVQVDWEGLKEKASEGIVRPTELDSDSIRELLTATRNLNLDIAGLHLPSMEMVLDRALVGNLISALELLRTTLDVKLRSRKLPGFDGREREKERVPAAQRR